MKIENLQKELESKIDQNLRIKEQNMRLRVLNQALSTKVEVKDQAIRQHIASIVLQREARGGADTMRGPELVNSQSSLSIQDGESSTSKIKSPIKRATVTYIKK